MSVDPGFTPERPASLTFDVPPARAEAVQAIGLMGALWASRLIQALLYDVRAWDPVTYAVVLGLVLVICLLAGYAPARRVARISAVDVLRR